MIPLFTEQQFQLAKTEDLLPLQCKQCGETFERTKHIIYTFKNPNKHQTGDFCSKKCMDLNRTTLQKVICKNCNKEFNKHPNQIKKSPNHFCSSSCAATFNNKNKKYGIKRSKLELYLEEKLPLLYPDIKFDFVKKDTIGSELDIYIPELKLAFEINGPTHYRPIFGEETFEKIKKNDLEKVKVCKSLKISLNVIDVSKLTYCVEKNFVPYLKTIVDIINLNIEINNLTKVFTSFDLI